MRSIRRVLPCLWLAVVLLAPAPAAAEPKPPTAEENADATFAKSFIGKTYEDEFDIDGWTDLGGGLVAPPIYVHEYQREADGTYLVLTSREAVKESPLGASILRRDGRADRGEAAEGFRVLHRLRAGERGRHAELSGRSQRQREQGMVDGDSPRLGDLARDRT